MLKAISLFPTPRINRDFQFFGILVFIWVIPASEMVNPPNPFMTACKNPPAPVAK